MLPSTCGRGSALHAWCGLPLTDPHAETALCWTTLGEKRCEGTQDSAGLSSGSSLITLGEVSQTLFSYVQKRMNRNDMIMSILVVTDQLWYPRRALVVHPTPHFLTCHCGQPNLFQEVGEHGQKSIFINCKHSIIRIPLRR